MTGARPSSPGGALRPVPDHATLLALTGGDAWVRWAVPAPLPGQVLTSGTVAAVERPGRRHGWWLLPLPGVGDARTEVAGTLKGLRSAGLLARAESVSVPERCAVVRDRLLTTGDGGDWEWMWTDAAPAAPRGESSLVELSDQADASEIMAFARRHNPRSWADAGSGRTQLWLGLRDGAGGLLAVGGIEQLDTGVPHLAGIVVDTRRRGQGLGRLVTATLTRRAVAGAGVCTLGVYADNAAAIALYHRLGFRTAHVWSSRLLAGRTR